MDKKKKLRISMYGENDLEIRRLLNHKINIQLPSLATGGYLWKVVFFSEDILEFEENEVRADRTEIFTFLTKKAGTTTIQFECKRPWEEKPYRELTFNVEVVEPYKPEYEMVKCISCGKELKGEICEGRVGMLYDGLICETRGNYGSTVFDLEDGLLQFYLCDKCAVAKGDQIEYQRFERQRPKLIEKWSFTEQRKKEDEFYANQKKNADKAK